MPAGVSPREKGAADEHRPVRLHSAARLRSVRVDLWAAGSGSIDKDLALVTDLPLAHEAFEAAVRLYPDRKITLRQGTRVLSTTKWLPLVR